MNNSKKDRVFKVSEVAEFSIPKSEYVSRMLIDSESVGAKSINVNNGILKPGNSTKGGTHPCPYEEIYYILRGQGVLTIGNETWEVGPDTVAYIPCEEYHRLQNTGNTDLEILTIMPLPLKEGANSVYDARKRAWGTSFRKLRKS